MIVARHRGAVLSGGWRRRHCRLPAPSILAGTVAPAGGRRPPRRCPSPCPRRASNATRASSPGSSTGHATSSSTCRPATTTIAHRRYPVLYMHDGQNLFDPSTVVRARTTLAAGRDGRHADRRGPRAAADHRRRQPHRHRPRRGVHADPGSAAGRRTRQGLRPPAHRRAEAVRRRPLPHPAATASTPGSADRRSAGCRRCSSDCGTPTCSGSSRCCRRRCGGDGARFCATWPRRGPGPTPASGSTSAAARAGSRSPTRGGCARRWSPPGGAIITTSRYTESAGATHSEAAWADRAGNVLEFLFPTDLGGWHF